MNEKVKKACAILLSTTLVSSMILPAPIARAGSGSDDLAYKATDDSVRKITTNTGIEDRNWNIVWSDEFNDSTLDDTKWSNMVGTGAEYSGDGWGNNEKEYYTDGENIAMVTEDNAKCLEITASKIPESQKAAYGGKDYTSARLWTMDDSKNPGGDKTVKFAKTYGRIEAKIKMSSGTGLWPAFWMMPANDEYGTWAASGELDIMEARGSNTNSVDGTIHYGSQWPNNKILGGSYNKESSIAPEDPSFSTEEWHTYAVEWLPGEIIWYVDDQVFYKTSNWYSTSASNATDYTYPAPFDQDFYILLNLAVGGNYDGGALDTSWDNAKMYVDYVRVYDLADEYGNTAIYDENVAKPKEEADSSLVSGIINETNYVDSSLSSIIKTTNYPGETNKSNWFLSELVGGKASEVVEDEILKVNVTNGGTQNYSVQVIHNVPLTKGYRYVLQFDGKADTDRTITAKYGNVGGYPSYSDPYAIDLSADWEHYTYMFDMTNTTDADARIEFNLGLTSGNSYFKNFAVICTGLIPDEDPDVIKEPLSNGNHIYNGTFDQGEGRTFFWHAKDGATISSVSTAKELKTVGAQTDSNVYQQGLNLLKNDSYKLTFDARAEVPGEVKVEFASKDEKNIYKEEILSLTTQESIQTVTFTMPEDITDKDAVVRFIIGNNTVYIDNVMMIRTSNNNIDWTGVDIWPMYNGDFYNGAAGWNIWSENKGWITTSAETGDLVGKAVINEGQDFWCAGIKSSTVKCKAGIPYNITINLRGDVAKKIKVETPDGAQADYDFAAGDNQLVIPFTPSADCNGNIALYLGVESGTYNFTLSSIDVAVDTTLVTPPLGTNKPGSITSAGDAKVGNDFIILHNNQVWADAITATYINGNQIDSNLVTKAEEGKIKISGTVIPSEGTYSVMFDANGYSKTKAISQKVISSDGNIIVNGSFDTDIIGWITFFSDWGPVVNGSAESVNGQAVISVNSTEGNNWDCQLKQANITVEESAYYLLSFDAYSDIERPIDLEFGGLGTASKNRIDLTTTKETYYVVLRDVAESSTASILYLMGNVNGCLNDFASVGPHKIYFDNVILKKATEEEINRINPPHISLKEMPVLGKQLVYQYEDNTIWEDAALTVSINGTEVPSSFVSVDKVVNTITIAKEAITEVGKYEITFKATGFDAVKVDTTIVESEYSNLLSGDWITWAEADEVNSMVVNNEDDMITVDFITTYISEWNTPEFWSLQAKKVGVTTLAGKSYQITFDADLTYNDSSVLTERGLTVEYVLNGSSKQEVVGIKPGHGTYTLELTPGESSDFYLMFMPGGAEFDIPAHTLKLSNISMIMNKESVEPEVPVEALETPSNVVATANNTNISITWNAVTNAGSYVVYRSYNGESYVAIQTVKENRYTDSSLKAGTYSYKVVAVPVENDVLHTNSLTSDETFAINIVNSPTNQVPTDVITVVVNAEKPVVTKPVDATYVYGNKASALTVLASTSDKGTLTYQWYVSETATGAGTIIEGATLDAYIPSVNEVGTKYYYCVVTNTNNSVNGLKTSSTTSSVASVTVNKAARNIKISSTKISNTYGDKAFNLNASGQGKITYKTSNSKVATVTSSGKVGIKGPGKAIITITAAGNDKYNKTTKSVIITVAPKKSKIKSATLLKNKMIVKWSRDSIVSGYQIQYATNSNFKGSKTITVSKNSVVSKTISRLKEKQTYYIRIRAYKKSGSTKIYGEWSKIKKVVVKN